MKTFRAYKDIQESMIEKESLLKDWERWNKEENMLGELKKFDTGSGNDVYNRANIPVAQILIKNSYSTVDGIANQHEVGIICIDTGYTDINKDKIYYSPEAKKLFIVDAERGDGWTLGFISIRSPELITDEHVQEFRNWQERCKEYNQSIYKKAADYFGTNEKIIENIKRENRYTIKDIEDAILFSNNVYVSKNLLDKFLDIKTPFSWKKFFEIFNTEKGIGNLPNTVNVIRIILKILSKTGEENNSHLVGKIKGEEL